MEPLPMIRAIQRSDEEAVADLVTRMFNLEVKDRDHRNTPLNKATLFGNEKIIKILVNAGCRVNTKNREGNTPLHNFIRASDSLEGLAYLLSRGAYVNAINERGMTPLHFCVQFRTVESIKLLLKFNAKVNMKDIRKSTPLDVAIEGQKDLEVIDTLIDAGANFHMITRNAKNYILGRGNSLMTEFFLKKGMNANRLSNTGNLRWPCDVGHPETIKLLLKYGFNVNVIYPNGSNVLDNCEKKLVHGIRPWDKKFQPELIFIEHIAILKTRDLEVHSSLIETIFKKDDYQSYFTQCEQELLKAKNTEFTDSWVTFFHLLIDDDTKLTKYAGNKNLVGDFSSTDWSEKFRIYGETMKKNFSKALENRKFRDDAAVILSAHLPIFDPTHLIIKDVLDCITENDWKKLCL